MKNILAENMLRFGTKNLKETTQRIKEEYLNLINEGLGDAVDTSLLQVPQDKMKQILALQRISPALKNAVQQLNTLNVPLPAGTPNPIYIMLYGGLFLSKAPRRFLGRVFKAKGEEQGKQIVDLLNPDALKFEPRGAELPINLHPRASGLEVAVIGSPISVENGMTSTEVEPGPHPPQDFAEFLRYLNAYNIAAWMALDKWDPGTQVNQYDIEEGYNMIGTDSTYVGDAQEGSYKGFVNTADWFEAANSSLIVYTSKKLTPETADTERVPETVEFIPGEKQKVPLPDETFVVGKAVLSETAKTTIKSKFLEAQKALAAANTKITSITLTSGASIDEKYATGTTFKGFAAESGIPEDAIKKALNNDQSKISVVPPAGPASPGRSGNDVLAVFRAKEFENFVKSFASGISVTSNAVVAKGKAGARIQEMAYETLTADGQRTIPAQLLNKGQAGSEVDMGGSITFQTMESISPVADLFDSSKRQTNISDEN